MSIVWVKRTRWTAGLAAIWGLFPAGSLTLATAAPAGPATLSSPPGEPTMKTYVYKTVGDVKNEADVFRPADGRVRPVLVWLHGGALISGRRKDIPQDLRDLARAEGYVLISADYRLAPEARLPQIIEDLRDFMRWVRDKGPALFAADPARLVVTGGSAGGYLTMMAGLCQPRPTALVAYWGYGDVDGPWYTQPSEFYRKTVALISKEDAWRGVGQAVLTGTQGGTDVAKARSQFYLYLRQNGLWTKEVSGFDPATQRKDLDPYCPVRNITAEYPPILMVHGTADTDVPYQESLDMAEELKRKGAWYELVTVEGAGHGLSGAGKDLATARRKALARAREYIKEKLNG
jgi:acetyl esterase/lipase